MNIKEKIMKLNAKRMLGCLIAAALLFSSVPADVYADEVYSEDEKTEYVMDEADAASEVIESEEDEAASIVTDSEEADEAESAGEVSEESSEAREDESAQDSAVEADEEEKDEFLSENASEADEELDDVLYPEEDDMDDYLVSDDFEEEIPDEITDDGDSDEFFDASGTDLDSDIKWTYSDDGTLTFSGTGVIRDYYKSGTGSTPVVADRPWKSYYDKATKLVVSEGITRIGHRAFQNFASLKVAELPDSLESIGEWAFQNCYALNVVVLPEFVSFENGAFRDAPFEADATTENILYKGSRYYKELTAVATNGNYRDDVIAIARSQMGYHEGDSEADYGGGNTDGSKDISEFGRYLESSGNAWCSEFASWCIRMAGVPTNQINSSKGANANTFTSGTSATYHPWSETVWGGGSYRPGKGDIILWVWKGSSVTYAYDSSLSHTTLLESISENGDTVTLNVVHGNSGNAVGTGTYVVNIADGSLSNGNGYVGYFVAPDYDNKAVTKYTITFNANGGTVSRRTKKVANGGLYGPLPIPTNGTKQFLGWYNSKGIRINMYSPCRITANETLNAKWSTPSSEVSNISKYLRDGAYASSIKAVSGTLKNSGEFGEGISAQIYTYTANGNTYRALYIWGENGKGSIGKYETVKSIYSSEKDSLTDIILDDSITKVVEQEMFSELSKVTYVRLSENLKELAGQDFKSCSAIPEITFPASLEKTGMRTIDGCKSLKTMTFEQGIKRIPDQIAKCGVVDSQIALETVNIPSSVTEIGESAFAGQKKLTTVNFLDLAQTTLSRIGPFAFEETNLSSITLPKFGGFWYDTSNNKRYPEISGLAFEYKLNPAFNTIIIPEGVVNLYEFTHDCKFEYIYLPTTIECSDDKDTTGFANSIFYDGNDTLHTTLKKIYYPGSEAQFLTKALGAKLPSAVENYKKRVWYDRVVFNVKAPSQIESITPEEDSIVFYHDDVKEGQSKTVTLVLDPANHLETTYKATSSNTEIVEASIGGEKDGNLALILKLHKKLGTATVTVTGGSASCRVTVIIKDKDPANKPKAKMLSGNGNENNAKAGDNWSLLSQTPNAQIFYIIDGNESAPASLNSSSYYNYNESTKKYSPNQSSIKEYRGNPLVVGEEITKTANCIHAVAIRYDRSFSLIMDKKITLEEDDGWGDVDATDRSQFSDQTKVPSGIWIPESQLNVPNRYYTGKAITISDLRVYYGKSLLAFRTDYSLRYMNNTNASGKDPAKPPMVEVNLTGNYSGKKAFEFNIVKENLTDETRNTVTCTESNLCVKLDKSDNPVAQKVDPKVKLNGKALKLNSDYTVSFKKGSKEYQGTVKEIGTYDATITGIGNYTGSIEIKKAVHVIDAKLVGMDKVQISSIPEQKMAEWGDKGYKVKPPFTVKYKGNLVDQSQYEPEFKGNDAAGSATLTLRGNGEVVNGIAFQGSKTITFKIKGLPFDKENVNVTGLKSNYSYTGTAIDPSNETGFSVKYNGEKLIKNKDYKISFNNAHTGAGKVSMTLEGAGKYTGKLKQEFTIDKIKMDDGAIEVRYKDEDNGKWNEWSVGSKVEYKYKKNGVKPPIVVKFGEKELSSSDYSVAYKNNNKLGKFSDCDARGNSIAPKVTITGKGSFQGTRTLTYTIKASELSELDMTLEDMVYANAPKKYVRKPVITDKNGAALREGTDYDKVFEYTYDSDTIITRVEGSGKKARRWTEKRGVGDPVSDLDIIAPGAEIKVRVNAKAGGCYTEYIEKTFVVANNSIKDLKFTVKKVCYYTGIPVTLRKDDIEVQRKIGGKWEIVDAHEAKEFYDIISYSNNIKKGTATMVVKAKNGYAGTAKVTFKINAKAK